MTQGNVIVGFNKPATASDGIIIVSTYGVAEGSGVNMGLTDGGIEVTPDRKIYEHRVDQAIGPIGASIVEESLKIKVNVAEASLANLAIAMAYPSTAVSSTTLSFGGNATATYLTLYINVNGVSGGTRKYTIHKAIVSGGGKHKYVRNGITFVDVEFTAFQDLTKTANAQMGTIVDTSSDTTAPTIAMTTPASGGTVVKATKGTILLTITETNALDENSIVYGDTVQVINTTSGREGLVAGAIAYDSTAKTITFTPTANWTASDTGMVTVSKGLRDENGNTLAATFTGTFSVTA